MPLGTKETVFFTRITPLDTGQEPPGGDYAYAQFEDEEAYEHNRGALLMLVPEERGYTLPGQEGAWFVLRRLSAYGLPFPPKGAGVDLEDRLFYVMVARWLAADCPGGRAGWDALVEGYVGGA